MIKRTAKRILVLAADVKHRFDAHINTRAKRIAVRTAGAVCAGAVIGCVVVVASNKLRAENAFFSGAVKIVNCNWF